MAEVLWQSENKALAVTIYDDAAATIRDKVRQIDWQMGRVALQEEGPVDIGHVWLRSSRSICEQYSGRFQGKREGNTLFFTLLGREHQPIGTFRCEVDLSASQLEFRILSVDEEIQSLVFPTPLVSESLVLPMGVGRWVRTPLPERFFWTYGAHLNMRWFGGLRGEAGWLAIVDEGYTDAGVLATGLSLAPAWLKSLGSWSGSRRILYQFVGGGYVGLAKAFRAYALDHNLHRSLSEKIESTPALRNLHGGRLLSFMQARPVHPAAFEDHLQPPPEPLFAARHDPLVMVSHSEVRDIVQEALQLGMKRALVILRGWCKGGYDEQHPDVWPPDPALGTLDELRELTVSKDPLTTGLHDNYQDIYQQSPSWPRGVNRSPAGHRMAGGMWAGGQAYILNSRTSLEYVKRNWQDIQILQPRAMFIDTTIAVKFYESYESGNELTRAQDEAFKREILQFYKEQGVVLGSEEGTDFGMPFVDWIETRHLRIPGESIPLWSLVYHDAAFCTRYGPGALAPETPRSPAPRWLTDMLWGYPLIWSPFAELQPAHKVWESMKADFVSLQNVDDWHLRIGSDEMISHRYLSEDGEVEETLFSSGTSITVNFASEPRTVEGLTLEGHSYKIRD